MLLDRLEFSAESQHGVHDDGKRRASAIRALRMVDRLGRLRRPSS
jgi:hypothetical protein